MPNRHPHPHPHRPANILLVEDCAVRTTSMISYILRPPWPQDTPHPNFVRRHNSQSALEYLNHIARGRVATPDAIFLDYDIDSFGGGGDKVVRALIPMRYPGVIVVHSANPVGGPMMQQDLFRAGYYPVYAPASTWRQSASVWKQVAEQV